MWATNCIGVIQRLNQKWSLKSSWVRYGTYMGIGMFGYQLNQEHLRSTQWQSIKLQIKEIEQKNQCELFVIVDNKTPVPETDQHVFETNNAGQFLNAFQQRIYNSGKTHHVVHVLLHTNGGDAAASLQISRTLSQYQGGPTVAIVPFRSYSAGTLIALSCKQLRINPIATLSPVDAQITAINPASWLPLPQTFSASIWLKSNNVLMQEMGKQWHEHQRMWLSRLISNNSKMLNSLTDGKLPHCSLFGIEDLKQWKYPVETNIPTDYVELIHALQRYKKDFSIIPDS